MRDFFLTGPSASGKTANLVRHLAKLATQQDHSFVIIDLKGDCAELLAEEMLKQPKASRRKIKWFQDHMRAMTTTNN